MEFKFTNLKFRNSRTHWRLESGDWKFQQGMSLLEILVAITIFAILGVVMSQAILLTLRGARKSESTLKAKENVTYALAVIERGLRNADNVTCPNSSPTLLNFTNENGEPSTFSCVGMGSEDSYIASGSARLTNSDITIKDCTITCSQVSTNASPTVTVDVSAGDKNTTGIENSTFTSTTQILLRSY